MSTKTTRVKRPAASSYKLRVVVTNAVYGKLCRRSLQRLPHRWKSKLHLLTFSRWEDIELPSRRAESTMFVSRLSDIPIKPMAKPWEGLDARHLLFLERLPVEAVTPRLLRLNIRNPHRLHVAEECDPHHASQLVYRLVRGMAQEEGPLPIVDAWMEDGQLVLLSPSFERLAVPLAKLSKFIGTERSKIRALQMDEDGRFLYWRHADVHLGWEQFRQIVDPTTAIADKRKSAEFNRRYGAAMRALREEKGLKQTDILGVTDRHLRRVELGQQSASKATLEGLAEAHGMTLENYLKELANRVGERTAR